METLGANGDDFLRDSQESVQVKVASLDDDLCILDDENISESIVPTQMRKSRNSVDSSIVCRSDGSHGECDGTVRRKRRKIYRGRNVGRLTKLLQMPVDIFCEIAAHLEPLDLLHLARSSRSFYQMLMSRNAKPFWRMARSSCINLPECPPDLSEPAYARLLFEKECHACLAPRVMKADYVLRVRLCHRCRCSNIVTGTALLEMIPGLSEELLECIPHRRRMIGYALKPVITSQLFYVVQAKTVFARFQSVVPQDVADAEVLDLRETFYTIHKELVKDVVTHAEQIESWFISDNFARKMRGTNTARQREANLRKKLTELGHQECDFLDREDTGWGDWYSIMNQPREITPRIWARVRPILESLIERKKARRNKARRSIRQAAVVRGLFDFVVAVIIERKKRDRCLNISYKEASLLPAIAALHEEENYPEEISQEIVLEKWNATRDQIEKEMDDFAVSARATLKGLVLAGQPNTSTVDTTDDAILRTAYFKCRACDSDIRQILTYPDLLEHHHGVQDIFLDNITTRYASILLSFFPGTSPEEICTKESRLQCLRCDEATHPMPWLELIEHYKSEQDWYDQELHILFNHSPVVPYKLHHDHSLDDRINPAFSVLDSETTHFTQEPTATCSVCTWPLGPPRTLSQVQSHMRRNHLKELDYGAWFDFF